MNRDPYVLVYYNPQHNWVVQSGIYPKQPVVVSKIWSLAAKNQARSHLKRRCCVIVGWKPELLIVVTLY